MFKWLYDSLFGVEEDGEEYSREFERLDRAGKIKREDEFKFKYKKPQILETINGNYDDWELANQKEAKLITILGKRRVGKTALSLNVGENLANKKRYEIQTIGMNEADLPHEVQNINDVNEVSNDSILVVGEGAIEGNSRQSMSKGNVNLGMLLPIISHKNVWIIWCSQSGQKTDKNTIFEADTIILLKPSLMQLEGERKAVKKLYEKYMPHLNKWARKVGCSKGVAVVYSEEFIGVIRGHLPSFWSNQISKSYKNKNVMK